MEDYGLIVVGAGTAGCVLAARLSADAGARVLLLEAGSAERTSAMSVPSAWPQNVGSAADWGYVTTGQAEAGQVPYPRGRALGGSSAINAMAHTRGHPAVYDGSRGDPLRGRRRIAAAPDATSTRSAPARWAPARSWIRSCGCTGSPGCGLPTRRSCR
jgi:choline dehydrogenase-like flavoprotein